MRTLATLNELIETAALDKRLTDGDTRRNWVTGQLMQRADDLVEPNDPLLEGASDILFRRVLPVAFDWLVSEFYERSQKRAVEGGLLEAMLTGIDVGPDAMADAGVQWLDNKIEPRRQWGEALSDRLLTVGIRPVLIGICVDLHAASESAEKPKPKRKTRTRKPTASKG